MVVLGTTIATVTVKLASPRRVYGSLLITHTALNSEHTMPCVLSTDLRTINLGDVNCTVCVINKCCWRHRILLRQCTIMDANHRGGWTQRFQTSNVTFKVTKGHPYWCHSVGHIRFPICLQLQLCVYLAPIPRYYTYF